MDGKNQVLLDYNGITYIGYLEPVHGAGAKVWHLMVGNYYWGRLRLTGADKWVFDGNREGLGYQVDTMVLAIKREAVTSDIVF